MWKFICWKKNIFFGTVLDAWRSNSGGVGAQVVAIVDPVWRTGPSTMLTRVREACQCRKHMYATPDMVPVSPVSLQPFTFGFPFNNIYPKRVNKPENEQNWYKSLHGRAHARSDSITRFSDSVGCINTVIRKIHTNPCTRARISRSGSIRTCSDSLSIARHDGSKL